MEKREAGFGVIESVPWANNLVARLSLRSGMTTATKSKGDKDKGDKAYAKTSRCWPGFEPVPGKAEHEEGSCRKVPTSKNGGKEVNRETARKKQVALGGERAEQAKGKSPNAAERKGVSKSAKSAKKRVAAKQAPAKKPAAKKSPQAA